MRTSSVDQSPPPGYTTPTPAQVISVGRAFTTFEVQAGDEVFVCKRTRLAALDASSAPDAQLAREAEILERLAKLVGGRGVPTLQTAGVDAHGRFVVMEKAAGTQLGALAKEDVADRLAAAAHVTFGALAAIHEAADAAGALDIVHGDISPSNVMLTPDASHTWIVDFGLATGRDWPPMAGGAFVGTLAFASPELARGEPLDARADIFALAATLVATAVGREPRLRGETEVAAQLARAAEEPLDEFLRAAAADLPTKAHAVLAALTPCLAFDRTARPASARAVLRVLATC